MFIGVFLAPILAVVIFNTVVFVLVIRVLIKHVYRRIGVLGTIRLLIRIFFFMVTFGIQWFFGAFIINEDLTTFQWFILGFSTLQGISIFLFFVILNQTAREEWLNVFLFCLGKRKKTQVMITSPANQSTHTTKNADNQRISKVVTSSNNGEGIFEMHEWRKNLFTSTPISENNENAFVIEDDARDYTPSNEEIDLAVEQTDEDDDVAHESCMAECYDASQTEYGDVIQLTQTCVLF